MQKRIVFIRAFVTLLPLLQLSVIGTGAILTNTALILSFSHKAYADNADFYETSADKKFNAKDYYGAISDYNKVIKINPNSVYALARIGRSKYYLKDYKGAIAILNKSIEIDSNYKFHYIIRGDVKLALGDYYGSISDYNKSLEIDPYDFFPYYFRAVAKKKIGDIQGACSDIIKADQLVNIDAARSLIRDWRKNNC